MSFDSLVLAEPKYLALFDPISGQVAFDKIIPFPVVADGAGGCRLSLELASPGMIFLFTIEGFEPGEELATTSKSNGEVLRNKQKFLKDSPTISGILPAVIGKDSGDASFTVEGAKCAVTLDYKWGKAARVFQ